MELTTKSIITCHHCGYSKEKQMPEDACVYFYECEECKTVLKPRPGDCCVFCSHGTNCCPQIQREKNGCDKY